MSNALLRSLFDSKNKIHFVVDEESVQHMFDTHGVKATIFDERLSNILSGVIVQTKVENFLLIEDEIELNKNSQILTIPQVAFDSSLPAVLYSMRRLFETDFEQAFVLYQHVFHQLKKIEKQFSIKTNEIDLHCDFEEEVDFSYPSTLLLAQGKPRSVASYLELHFEDLHPGKPKYFALSGSMNIKGMVFAVHPRFQKTIPKQLQDNAYNLLKSVSKNQLATITFHHNMLTSFTIDGIEYIETLHTLVGPTLGLKLTEFAFGLNRSIYHTVDWGVNAQINEGVSGIHIGIGDGKSGIHMDFICPVENLKEII